MAYHLVRKYALLPVRHRRGTARAEPALGLVNDRLNYLNPTKKPIGWGEDKARRKRLYDKPQTPLNRLLAAGTPAPAQQRKLIAYRAQLNPLRSPGTSPTSRPC